MLALAKERKADRPRHAHRESVYLDVADLKFSSAVAKFALPGCIPMSTTGHAMKLYLSNAIAIIVSGCAAGKFQAAFVSPNSRHFLLKSWT